MTFTINTHDSWGVLKVADFATLEEARQAFSSLCQDPWYRDDGTVRGVELLQTGRDGAAERLDWFAFR